MNKGWEEVGAGIWTPELTAVMVAQGVGFGWVAETDSAICVTSPLPSSETRRRVVQRGERRTGRPCCDVNKGSLEDRPLGYNCLKENSLLYNHKFFSNLLSLKDADRKKNLLQRILMSSKKKRVMAEIASCLLYGLRNKLRAMVFEVWPVFKTQP